MTTQHTRSALIVLVPLALSLAVAGCSKSSGGGGGAGSTAAGSTAPGATGTMPAAPASQGVALDRFNQDFQDAWDRMLPGLKTMLQDQANGLAGSVYDRGAIKVEIANVKTMNSDMAVAPGLASFTNDKLVLRVPRQGTWELVLEADIKVTLTITGSIAPSVSIPVKITVQDLTAEVEAEFDHSDPTRPALTRVGQPNIGFNVKIDSSSSLLQQITPVLTPVADILAHYALNNALGGVLPVLNSLPGIAGPVPGLPSQPWQDSGVNTPFEEIMVNIGRKTRRDNQPYGTVLGAIMDTSAQDTWEQAYVNGGGGNPGTVVRYGSGGDSAIFTGQYLAANAFHYASTGDPDALGNLNHTLRGVANLLDVNGNGLLARCVAPVGSVVANSFSSTYKTTQLRGQDWVSYPGGNGISRDQYSGVFFGLSITWELVPDPLVRAECERLLQLMLDYLILNKWVVDEDRTPVGQGSRGPTFWAGIPHQKVTFLLMGHRMDQAKYAQDLAEAGPLSETAWFGAWTSVFGYDHYYKFNLSHLAYYNYFRLDTDQGRWQDFARAFRIIRRYVGHHKNAHFDLIAAEFDPSTQAIYWPQTREVMRRFLTRHHREWAGPVVDLSNVTFVPFSYTHYQNGQGSAFTIVTTTENIPSEPLDIKLRKITGHFFWQRDPFSPATPNRGNDKYEKHGLDAVGPYWMGRYHGAF